MNGAYSEIEIVAPSIAEVGAPVDVEVRITNLVDYTIYAIPVINVNGDIKEGSYETIVPGETHSWYFQFTMPEQSVKVTAESWCEDTFEWHLDDTAQINIALAGLPSLWPLALVGGLGILGVGAAVVVALKGKSPLDVRSRK